MTTHHQRREERFRSLYADAYEDVLRFVQRRVDPSHAEDVAAEAFLVAWRRLEEAPARPDDLRAWLFGVARHCLLNARRGQRRGEALAVRIAAAVPTESDTERLDQDLVALRIDLMVAWQQLAAGDQEVLALTVFEGLNSRLAGRVMGITPVAYRVRLVRARRDLRRHLEHPISEPRTTNAVEEAAQ